MPEFQARSFSLGLDVLYFFIMKSKAQVFDAKSIAEKIRKKVCYRIEELKKNGTLIHVVTLLASDNPATRLYVEKQCKHFTNVGIKTSLREIRGDLSEDTILTVLKELNCDPLVTGIIVALPLPDGVDVRCIQESILPGKDVEGVHPQNLGRAVCGRNGIGPSTAQAVLEILDSLDIDFRGRETVVVGHSEIVGKPVALGLMDRLSTVTVCHIATKNLAFHTRRAEILVTAVGKPNLITREMVLDGAIIVDVGINQITDSSGKRKIVGDVDFAGVLDRVSFITPVPGGVGPVTLSVLMRNAVKLVYSENSCYGRDFNG